MSWTNAVCSYWGQEAQVLVVQIALDQTVEELLLQENLSIGDIMLAVVQQVVTTHQILICVGDFALAAKSNLGIDDHYCYAYNNGKNDKNDETYKRLVNHV